MTKARTREWICFAVAIIGIVFLLAYEFVGIESLTGKFDDTEVRQMVDMTVTRFVGGVIFLAMLINLGYRVLNPLKRPFWRSLLFCAPAFLVAINNFPFVPVITGAAVIEDSAPKIILLLVECLCIGFFEELAFRGLFLWVLEKKHRDRKWAFISVLISSAAFGLIHLINLYQSSPFSVFLQIGYSFLIGAMCSVVLLRTSNIWLCAVIHGLFNFAGAVVPTCGHGEIWDAATVILTVIIALLVTAYMTIAFFKTDMSLTDGIYGKNQN